MLHAASEELVDSFANFLKRIVFVAETRARIGFSGSSMITFLQSVRSIRPNCFHLFTQSKYVLLGDELSRPWATRIAHDLKRAMIDLRPSPSLSSDAFTTDRLLRAIEQEKAKLNLRPAIIHQLIWNFKSQNESNVPREVVGAKLSQALRAITTKMDDESVPDFMLALGALKNDRSFLKSLRQLAEGTTRGLDLFKDGPGSDSTFAALLCGQDEFLSDLVSRLLPPYAHLCKQFILPETGDIVLDLSKYRISRTGAMSVRFQSMLNACSESAGMFNPREQALISRSIVEVLFKNGIGATGPGGVLIPVQSVFDHPLLTAMHRTSLKGHRVPDQFEKELAAYKAGRALSDSLPVGMRVLHDLRNIQSHLVLYGAYLRLNGWPVVVLEELAKAFSDCLPDCAVPYDMTEGFAVVSQAAIDAFKAEQRQKLAQGMGRAPPPHPHHTRRPRPVPTSTAPGTDHAPASQNAESTAANSQQKNCIPRH